MNMHQWGDSSFFINMPLFMIPFIGLITLAVLWSMVWKGLALWHSAQRADHWWFIAFLLVNTLGILEIVYLFGFAKVKADKLFSRHSHHSHHAHH